MSTCPLCRGPCELYEHCQNPKPFSWHFICSECGKWIIIADGNERFNKVRDEIEIKDFKTALDIAQKEGKIVVFYDDRYQVTSEDCPPNQYLCIPI